MTFIALTLTTTTTDLSINIPVIENSPLDGLPQSSSTEGVNDSIDVRLNTGEALTIFEHEVISDLVTTTLPRLSIESLKSFRHIQGLLKRVFDSQYRKELARVNRLVEIRRIIYACVVRQVILHDRWLLPAHEDIQAFPFFTDPDLTPANIQEIECLKHFLRAVRVLYHIGVPGSNNKQTYIDVASMLDGSNRSYAFGGSPSKATIRRAMIYHIVTNTPKPTSLIQSIKRRRKASKIDHEDDHY